MLISKLEIKERQEHIGNTGMEITRLFYVEPYEAHTELIALLLGSVQFGIKGQSVRTDPMTDSYYDFCYCTDTSLNRQHPDAMCSDPSLGITPTSDQDDVTRIIKTHREKAGGATNLGVYINATFKPLVFTDPSDTGSQDVNWDRTRFSKWDMANPQMEPITKIANVGKTAKFLVADYTSDFALPATPPVGSLLTPYASFDSDAFITQPMSTFTIERRMCASVPLETIARLKGKVNAAPINFGNGYYFPAECLRFDEATIVKRTVPRVDGTLDIWFDITYQFTFNSIWDEYWDEEANTYKQGYVTWNRAIGCPAAGCTFGLSPAVIGGGVVMGGTPTIAHTAYYPVGWKSSVFGFQGIKKLYPLDTSISWGITNDGGNPVSKTFKNLFYSDES